MRPLSLILLIALVAAAACSSSEGEGGDATEGTVASEATAASNSGEPTVAYDGTAATYSGPTTVQEGVTPITYHNDSEQPTHLSLIQVKPDCRTLEEAAAVLAASPPDTEDECFVEMVKATAVSPGRTEKVISYLDPGTVEVVVFWGSGASERGIPVAHLEVLAD